MEVILREDYAALGYLGDRVQVKRGFARNFLIPRGLAIEAWSQNQKQLRHQLDAINSRRAKLKSQAEALSQQVGAVELSFTIKVGEKGKSFGSVTAKDIEAQLKEKGFEVDRRRIKLLDAIRRPGTYSAEVRLHAEVAVTVAIKVQEDLAAAAKEAEEAQAAAEAGEKKRGGRKGGRGRKAAKGDEAQVSADGEASTAGTDASAE